MASIWDMFDNKPVGANPAVNPYANMSGMMGNPYQNPMMGAMGGASRAIAPLMGPQERPVSMGQFLAAAGGGAMQGGQQAQMQNMQMQEVQQKFADAKTARERAAQQQSAMQNLAKQYPQYAHLIAAGKGDEVAAALTRAPVAAKTEWAIGPDGKPGMFSEAEIMQKGYQPIPKTPLVDMGNDGLPKHVSGRINSLYDTIPVLEKTVDNASSMYNLASQTPTGAGADFKVWGAKWADALGFPVDMDEIANMEQFKAKQMDFVMERIAGTKGAISEKEMAAFKESVPNMGNTPRGNMIIAKVMEAQARREMELNLMEASLLEGGASRSEAIRQVSKRRDEFRKTPVLSDDELAEIKGFPSKAAMGEVGKVPSTGDGWSIRPAGVQ